MGWRALQLQVNNSPFNQEQVDLLNRLLPTLNATQKVWLSGYLAASAPIQTTGGTLNESHPAGAPAVSKEVTILYGSQSGNAQGLAKKSAKVLEANGFQVNVSSMSDFKTNQLKKVRLTSHRCQYAWGRRAAG